MKKKNVIFEEVRRMIIAFLVVMGLIAFSYILGHLILYGVKLWQE